MKIISVKSDQPHPKINMLDSSQYAIEFEYHSNLNSECSTI